MKLVLVIAALSLAAPPGALAQADYPSQPIRLVVPFTTGSTSDISARAIAQKIGLALGQQVIVENRPGANGGIGMQAVARSKPDGYTLVVGSVSSTVVPAVGLLTSLYRLLVTQGHTGLGMGGLIRVYTDLPLAGKQGGKKDD